jgi:hypothetical protein
MTEPNYRTERVERLLKELQYEITREDRSGLSKIRHSPHSKLTKLAWHRMKRGGKRYERWLRIRPSIDSDIGDHSWIRYIARSRAKINNRDYRRQCGYEN